MLSMVDQFADAYLLLGRQTKASDCPVHDSLGVDRQTVKCSEYASFGRLI